MDVRRVFHIAEILAVASCFSCSGAWSVAIAPSTAPTSASGTSGIRSRLPLNRQRSLNCGTSTSILADDSSILPWIHDYRPSKSLAAVSNAHADPFLVRGGSSEQDDGEMDCKGTTGTCLAEADPDVWEIIAAERRRQVGRQTVTRA